LQQKVASILPGARVLALGLVGIGGVAWLDRLTGGEIAFSAFYALPVSYVAWNVGRRLGLLLAGIAAAIWALVDLVDHTYSHPSIHAWNGLVRLAFFATIAVLLHRVRMARDLAQTLAVTDALTGVANTRSFYSRLELEIARARRGRGRFSLVYFDLDDFKAINDERGHVVGDHVLRAVAACAIQVLRSTDLLARLGGDEFAALLADTNADGAQRAVAKLQQALLTEMDRRRFPVTFSFGAISFDAPPAGTCEAIQAVDGLMYRVKHRGKNGVEFALFPGDGSSVGGAPGRPR
jgi:diguanylate cyclase (GGDEF)-like protein